MAGSLVFKPERPSRGRNSRRLLSGLLVPLLIGTICTSILTHIIWSGATPSNSSLSHSSKPATAASQYKSKPTSFTKSWGSSLRVMEAEPKPETLVLYIFSNTDREYYHNLEFFIRNGIREGDGCEYIIVINSNNHSPEVELPELPSNTRYVRHENKCYDWGTFGWVLRTQGINTDSYKHFIFLNSSVRGPFLPPYMPADTHFSHLMTSQLSDTVKLVGPTISCEAAAHAEEGAGATPHVQSFAVATDQTGLRVLVEDGRVFKCHSSMQDTIQYSEIGSSKAILQAGYNLASFMTRYQGVDWREKSSWNCNKGENPFNGAAVDDVALHPMELMFVKVKYWGIRNAYPSMRAAAHYDTWKGAPQVHEAAMVATYQDLAAHRVLKAAAKGPDCWDCAFYLEQNPDVAGGHSAWACFEAFKHFANYGQFQLRPHRWLCEVPWEGHGVPFRPHNTGERWPAVRPDTCPRPLPG